jgi:hypothetical protein
MPAAILKRPAEKFSLAFSFADVLTSGETISSVAVSVSARKALDSAPAAMIAAAASIDVANKAVLQPMQGGVDNEDYVWLCTATLSSGRVLQKKLLVAVRAAG